MFEQSAILFDTWSQCSFNIIKFMLNAILRQGYLSLKEINPNPIISLASSVKFEDNLRLCRRIEHFRALLGNNTSFYPDMVKINGCLSAI